VEAEDIMYPYITCSRYKTTRIKGIQNFPSQQHNISPKIGAVTLTTDSSFHIPCRWCNMMTTGKYGQ